jgi:predicted peroxiredoxin
VAKFLFILSRGLEDPTRSTRCLQIAHVAKEEGHDVHIFFIDDGVFHAIKGLSENVVAPTGDEMINYMDFLIKAGVPFHVCTPCAKARKLDENEFIDNAKLDTAMTLVALAAESSVLSF